MTPPRFLVFVVRLLLPRACREHVLGDLHERYASPFAYAIEAAGAVAAAIVGQIRKATPLPFLLLEPLLVYASFFTAALSLRGTYGDPGWAHANASELAGITAIVMAGLLWRDAYSALFTHPNLKLIAMLREAGLKLTRFRLKLLIGTQLIGGVYLSIYFSCGILWIAQLVFPKLGMYPGIMTDFRGIWWCSIAISLLRIWIEINRRPSDVRPAL